MDLEVNQKASKFPSLVLHLANKTTNAFFIWLQLKALDRARQPSHDEGDTKTNGGSEPNASIGTASKATRIPFTRSYYRAAARRGEKFSDPLADFP